MEYIALLSGQGNAENISEKAKPLEAFEMWRYRKMLNISWMDNVTNEKVIERVLEGKQIIGNYCQKTRRIDGPYNTI